MEYSRKPKILIADDEEALLEIYYTFFTERGFEVRSAINGEELWRRIKDFTPDVILLDIIMPILDGISTLKQLKADPSTKHIPVIIFTNLDTEKDIAEANAAGCALYLIKANCSPSQLAAKIQEVLTTPRSN